jgi:hypothetical protein
VTSIPFEQIQSVSLAQADRLLSEWFPRGRRFGKEFKVGNIQGDSGESLSINLATGRWADFAGDHSGHDLIDLRAAMRHGGDRIAAASELGEMLGITVNGKDAQPKARHADDDWQPIVPPPSDAPEPSEKLLHCDMLHKYCGPDDRVLFYVRRHEARDGQRKQFYPLTFGTLNGKTGWHNKSPNTPKPLYRLNWLSHAEPDAIVILCEGEKSAEAAQRMYPDHVAMSWMGGAGAVAHADLRPLHGRDVIIWPDNDADGRKAADELRRRLPGARALKVDDLPDGDDAADLEGEGCDDPSSWLEQRLPPRPTARILAGAEFIKRHVPPVWLIDGIVQRSRLYACTSLTGHGKTAVWLFNGCMIQSGRMIGNLDVFQGNVLFLAGENPSDLEARMIGTARAYNIPTDRLPFVLPGSFPLTEDAAAALEGDIAALGVPLALIVGDTASSFFPGDEENSNVQAGNYARTLRTLTDCKGNPAVVALCHPTKGAARSTLLPRGGGAFLNELDGNLTLWSPALGEITELHWCGKIRGPDFSPLGFRLCPVPTDLTDEKGRPEMTIVAEPMSDEAVADARKQATANENVVLRTLRDKPDWSYAQIAKDAGWIDGENRPEKWRVQRAIASLHDDKLVIQVRKGAPWTLTAKGEQVIKEASDGRSSDP